MIGLGVVIGANLAVWTGCFLMFNAGYKLKA